MNTKHLMGVWAVTVGAMMAAGGIGCSAPAREPAVRVAIERPAGIDDYATGLAAMSSGDTRSAIEKLESAVAQNGSLRMARIKLGELYAEQGLHDRALPHLEVAAELDPYTPSNHRMMGVSLQVLDRLPEAASAYLKTLRLDPRDFTANMNLGLVYFAFNDLEPAATYLDRATRVNAESARGWLNLGVVQEAQGRADLAESSYRKSLELDPKSTSALRNLTANLIAQGKPADAVAVAELLVRNNDTPASHKRLADALTLAGRYDEALKAYDNAFANDARFTAALNGKASLYLLRYQRGLEIDDTLRELAVATWRQSLAINPQQRDVVSQVRKWENPSMLESTR